ncbi:MAG TPA: OmpA family protein, partial [Bdellovibrionales bacterium]|nr:OmpA family protein [Bdellovibrionales bacterium]
MTRFMYIILLAVALVGVSCAKAKKAEEAPVQAGETTGDPSVTNEPITFNPSGSDSGQIEGLQTIYFAYDQAQLTGEARRALQGNADWIKARPDTVVQIEGHCDNRGSTEYNLALGERRAKAVRAYLVSLGVDANRLSVMSYG